MDNPSGIPFSLPLLVNNTHSTPKLSLNNTRALTLTLAPVLAMSALSPRSASPKPASLPPLEADVYVI